jgi:hypothetical protein
MKLSTTVIGFVVAASFLVGCRAENKGAERGRPLDTWLARTIRDEGMRNAIITQRTLFPYHFITDSEELNELGKLDLAVLVRHYRDYPGSLNVRRGDADTTLYEGRVKKVRDLLEKAGLNAQAMKIADAMPGGPGVQSEHAIRILEKERTAGRGAGTAEGASAREGTSGVRGATAQASSKANR